MNLNFIKPYFTTEVVELYEALRSGKPFIFNSKMLCIPLEPCEEVMKVWACFVANEQPKLYFDCDFIEDGICEMVDNVETNATLKMIPYEEDYEE